MNNIKVGLIGVGALAEMTHLVNLKGNPHITVDAIVDVDIARAKDIAAKHHITNVFKTIEDMIAKTEVSAVVVSTPNQTHIPIAKKAAKHGIHVFIEKPIGTNLDEVRSYLEDAKKGNIITMIGMTHRFRRDSTLLKDYMDNRTFGDVHYAKAKLYRQRGTPAGWFTNKELAGGGAMMDIGVHVLDLAWWLMGKPAVKSITGKTMSMLGDYQTKYMSRWESKNKNTNVAHLFNVEDFGSAWIRFVDGSVLSLEIAWALNGEQDEEIRLELFGEKGGASLSPLTIFKEEHGVLNRTNPLFEDTDPFKEEINHFIDCVRNGTTPLSNGEDGYEVLKMLQGIYESSDKQQEIKFE